MIDILQNEWVINIGGAVISGIILEILLSKMKKNKDDKVQSKHDINVSNVESESIQQNTNRKVVNKETQSFTGRIIDFIKFLITAIFRILAITIVLLGISLIVHILKSGDKSSPSINNKAEVIQWNILNMGDMIPEPISNKIAITSNSEKWLSLDVYEVTEGDCYTYVHECENEFGFNVDAEKVGSSFWGYNEKGYKLSVMFVSDHISIDLRCPIEFGEYELPEYAIKEGLPLPKSKLGYYEWKYDDNFNIKIGNTTFEEYQNYVKECMEADFTKDSQEGKDFYNGDNKRGYELSVGYDGYNTMHIDFDSPKDN